MLRIIIIMLPLPVCFQISHEVSDVLNKALCIIEPELVSIGSSHQRYIIETQSDIIEGTKLLLFNNVIY